MKTKTRKMLPKTSCEISNGGVYVQNVRCGKTNCKCARGEAHRAFYFFTRCNGKLIKTYIRKADLEAFAQMVNQSAADRAEKRMLLKEVCELLKRTRGSLGEYELIIKRLKEKKGSGQF